MLCVTSVLLSLSGTVLCCVVCDVCVAVIVRHSFVLCCVLRLCCCHCQAQFCVVLCVTSVLLSLSDTMIVVVCDVCVAVIVRHSFVLCCV